MLKIVTVVGARPQFVKAAVVSQLVRGTFRADVREFLVHTGQHYDPNMSAVFFDEIGIPAPDVNLGVGSGPHGKTTAAMLSGIEEVLLEQSPDYVLVYGDTNSTLAGTLAASKLVIPVVHVEAGLRSRRMSMPEEQNRVVADHLATLLFCPTENARRNLSREGLTKGVHTIGDVMYDACLHYSAQIRGRGHAAGAIARHHIPCPYYLLTVHRAENTDDAERLAGIVRAIGAFRDLPAVFPLHPRTGQALRHLGLELPKNVVVIEPVGYLDMLELEQNCEFVVTDSGGVQKEAYFLAKPCITLREETEWIETVDCGWNRLVGSDEGVIVDAMSTVRRPKDHPRLYGDGTAGEQILRGIVDHARNVQRDDH